MLSCQGNVKIFSMKKHVVLETLSGSRLYGLETPSSDWDYYRVILDPELKKTDHSITEDGEFDNLTSDFNRFQELVFTGTHQALEALWSPIKVVDPNYLPFFEALRPNINMATEKYYKAIKHVGQSHGKKNLKFSEIPYKHKRHALRLALNLGDLWEYGKFNPRLSEDRVSFVNTVASLSKNRFYTILQRVTPVDLQLWD